MNAETEHICKTMSANFAIPNARLASPTTTVPVASQIFTLTIYLTTLLDALGRVLLKCMEILLPTHASIAHLLA
jgi:hypothetical protein